MKAPIAIILFSLCSLFTACHSIAPYPEAMQKALHCMEQHPDSARLYLASLDSSICQEPKETQMYYKLLKTKAEYKNYIQQASDSIMKEVVHFYESQDDTDKLMESYYYLSTIYQDMRNVPLALKVCQQAAQVGKNSKQYLTMGRVYQDIGTLLAYQSLYEEALIAYQTSYSYYAKENKPGKVYALRNIGRIYNSLNKKDSAQYYYQTAYQQAYQLNNTEQIENIGIELTNTLLGWNQIEKAQKVFTQIPVFTENAIYLQGKARYYLSMEQPDSAEYYYKQTLQKGKKDQNIYLKSSSYRALAELEVKKGNYSSAYNYVHQYMLIEDSIKHITQTETIGKIHALYNYKHIEKKNAELLGKNQLKNRLLFGAVVGIMTIAIVFYRHIKRQKKHLQKQKQQIQEIKKQQEQISLFQIKKNEEKIAALEKEIEFSQKEKSKLIQQVKLLRENSLKIQSIHNEKSLLENILKQSDIYMQFHQRASLPMQEITDSQWQDLQQIIDKTYADFTRTLYKLYPQISQQELRICYLIKIEMPIKEIANILCRSTSAISNARTRLYKKIHGKEGKAEDLDRFILDL